MSGKNIAIKHNVVADQYIIFPVDTFNNIFGNIFWVPFGWGIVIFDTYAPDFEARVIYILNCC